jgi:hypothetical protein
MGVHRVFLPIKSYPAYNNTLDHLIMNSSILNNDANDIHSVHSTMWNRSSLEYYLAQRIGDEDGFIVLNGRKELASMPFVKGQLDQLDKNFAQFKADKVKAGFKVPDLMPAHLMEEYYTLHARLTCLQMEAENLQKRLSEFKDAEDEESDSMLLKYGLQARGKLHDGILVLIDGQKCEQTREGIIIINDPRSPYTGMAVEDYRELCKTFQASRKENEKNRLRQLQREAKEKGNNIPKQLPVSAPHI